MKAVCLSALLVVGDAFGAFEETCEHAVATDAISKGFAGGTLYVYDKEGPAEWASVLDLGDVAVAGGCTPKFKPHMVLPSPDGTMVAISYTGDKFIHVVDATTKEIIACLDATNPTAGVEGGAVHTGAWNGNGEFIMCDMTGTVNGVAGGALHKFVVSTASYVTSIGMGPSAAARGTSGTKPISLGTNMLGAYADLFFVTDAKGAGSIINATSMAVVMDLALGDFAPCASGGLWVEAHPTDESIVIAQYGAQDSDEAVFSECLFKISLESLSVEQTYVLPSGADDAHGLAFCTSAVDGTEYLVNTNRVSATLDILEYETGAVVVDEFDLNAAMPESVTGGLLVLQPDVIFLDQDTHKLYIAARGPSPLSAVKAQNYFADATPGLFSFTLAPDCLSVTFDETDIALKTDLTLPQGDNVGDVHGIWGVNGEVWAIDQAATGSVRTTETFFKCSAEEAAAY